MKMLDANERQVLERLKAVKNGAPRRIQSDPLFATTCEKLETYARVVSESIEIEELNGIEGIKHCITHEGEEALRVDAVVRRLLATG